MMGTEIHGTIQSPELLSNEHHTTNPSGSKNDKVHIVAPIMNNLEHCLDGTVPALSPPYSQLLQFPQLHFGTHLHTQFPMKSGKNPAGGQFMRSWGNPNLHNPQQSTETLSDARNYSSNPNFPHRSFTELGSMLGSFLTLMTEKVKMNVFSRKLVN